jgi:hypothetical protein
VELLKHKQLRPVQAPQLDDPHNAGGKAMKSVLTILPAPKYGYRSLLRAGWIWADMSATWVAVAILLFNPVVVREWASSNTLL